MTKTADARLQWLRRSVTKLAANLVLAIIIIGLCFIILQPLLNKISISFMSQEDLYDSTIVSIPRNPTLDNYKVAAELMDFGNSLMYTFSLAMANAVIQVLAALLVGYGFARYDFPLKGFCFTMVILVIVIPPQTYSAALALDFRYFDVLGIFKLLTGNTLNLSTSAAPILLLGMTCTGLKCGIYIFLFRQYFRNIPKDLEEAAYLDGCGTIRTLFKVMLPDAMPLATSCFLFSFVWQWTDNYFSSLLMRSSNLLPVQLSALQTSLIYYTRPERPSGAYQNAMNATGTLMLLIPVIVVYLIAQKKFVESLSSTGVKM